MSENPREDRYILSGGDKGADRLAVLAQALWPGTRRLLDRIGLGRDHRCLDLGCGSGDVTIRIADCVGDDGLVRGVDRDERVIERARGLAGDRRNVEFHVGDVTGEDWALAGSFDFVFTRFLLSHLTDPGALLARIRQCLTGGGAVVIEDIDITRHVFHPETASLRRFMELYSTVAARRGVHPSIGPTLVGLLQQAGYDEIQIEVRTPTFFRGIEKSVTRLTLESIKPSVVGDGLATSEEVEEMLREIGALESDERTLISTAQIYQVWGRPSR